MVSNGKQCFAWSFSCIFAKVPKGAFLTVFDVRYHDLLFSTFGAPGRRIGQMLGFGATRRHITFLCMSSILFSREGTVFGIRYHKVLCLISGAPRHHIGQK